MDAKLWLEWDKSVSIVVVKIKEELMYRSPIENPDLNDIPLTGENISKDEFTSKGQYDLITYCNLTFVGSL